MAIQTTDFKFPGQTDVYHGKVRDVYTIGENTLVSVATDRISAFDVILPRPIPFKGQVLNQLAAYFLNATSDIAPNWLLDVPDPNVSIGNKCKPFAIEMVIRGYLVGYAWRAYQSGERVLCGIELPDGMQEYDAFPKPIITPSTKAQSGHDEDISAEDIVANGLATAEEFEELSLITQLLFQRGQEMAAERGLILADTKYEFGVIDDRIYVIDEIHTPDSSRYFYADSFDKYIADRTQDTPKHLSKEFVRQWLLDQGFSGQADQQPPEMSDDFVDNVSKRYIELIEHLSGSKFEPADSDDPIARINENVTNALEELV